MFLQLQSRIYKLENKHFTMQKVMHMKASVRFPPSFPCLLSVFAMRYVSSSPRSFFLPFCLPTAPPRRVACPRSGDAAPSPRHSACRCCNINAGTHYAHLRDAQTRLPNTLEPRRRLPLQSVCAHRRRVGKHNLARSVFGEGKRSCTCEQPRLCAHFSACLASKFVFLNFLFTPAEYKFLFLEETFMDYISEPGKFTTANSDLQRKSSFRTLQDSLPLSGSCATFIGTVARRLFETMAEAAIKASPQCWQSSDLICDPRLSAHREEGREQKPQTPERGEKVITPPLLLMCDRQHASAAQPEANRRAKCNFVSAAP